MLIFMKGTVPFPRLFTGDGRCARGRGGGDFYILERGNLPCRPFSVGQMKGASSFSPIHPARCRFFPLQDLIRIKLVQGMFLSKNFFSAGVVSSTD